MIPILDIETAPDPLALPLIQRELDEITAPANYKDPEKIAAYVAEKRTERIAKCAVDIDTLRIVAIGFDHESLTDAIDVCQSEAHEMAALVETWRILKALKSLAQHAGDDVIVAGHFVKTFDLPAIIRRSQILGVTMPHGVVKLDRYRGNVLDLADLATWNRAVGFPKSMEFYARRFGVIGQDEPYSKGADVPGWVEAGDWHAIEDHLRQDLRITRGVLDKLAPGL